MIETQPARPTPLSRVWSGHRVIAEDLDGDDLSDVMELHADASAWWVLDRRTEAAARSLNDLAGVLDLDKLAVSDLLATDQRVKYEELGQSRIVLTNVVSLDRSAEALTVVPMSLLVTDRALICVAAADCGFSPAGLLSSESERLSTGGVEAGLRLILNQVVDGYAGVVEWLESGSDDLADALFGERPLSRAEQLRSFRLRKVLSRLRRVTEPMRVVVNDLVESADDTPQGNGHPSNARAWSVVSERFTLLANAADQIDESLSTTLDTSLSLANTRMTEAMKKLAGWAAIIAVPTLVTGFVGMNVAFPLDGTVAGFWFYSVLLVVIGLVLFAVFRRRDWI